MSPFSPCIYGHIPPPPGILLQVGNHCYSCMPLDIFQFTPRYPFSWRLDRRASRSPRLWVESSRGPSSSDGKVMSLVPSWTFRIRSLSYLAILIRRPTYTEVCLVLLRYMYSVLTYIRTLRSASEYRVVKWGWNEDKGTWEINSNHM